MITSSSRNLIAEYKKKIHVIYSFTDLGPIHWLLEIKITWDRKVQTTRLSRSHTSRVFLHILVSKMLKVQ